MLDGSVLPDEANIDDLMDLIPGRGPHEVLYVRGHATCVMRLGGQSFYADGDAPCGEPLTTMGDLRSHIADHDSD